MTFLFSMKLKELLETVKDERLPQPMLEKYRDELIHLQTMVLMERADLQKKEAFYFLDNKKENDVSTKRAWRVTPEGQRLIELDAYKSALPKEIKSLESRVYALLRIN